MTFMHAHTYIHAHTHMRAHARTHTHAHTSLTVRLVSYIEPIYVQNINELATHSMTAMMLTHFTHPNTIYIVTLTATSLNTSFKSTMSLWYNNLSNKPKTSYLFNTFQGHEVPQLLSLSGRHSALVLAVKRSAGHCDTAGSLQFCYHNHNHL